MRDVGSVGLSRRGGVMCDVRGGEGEEMKYLLVFVTLLFLVMYSATSKGDDEAIPSESTSTRQVSVEEAGGYPIAPGVWYPGEPMPEKPMRYYRVRCWPGCHRGSSYGKYPDVPLNMQPIFPTRTLDLSSTLSAGDE